MSDKQKVEIHIHIDKLADTINISNLTENTDVFAEKVTKALIEAVNDAKLHGL